MITSHMMALTNTVSGDLTYFSLKFIESGFITQTAIDDILTQHGVDNREKARQILNFVRQNYITVADKLVLIRFLLSLLLKLPMLTWLTN